MMAQKFHQETFLGVSGFQCDTIDIYRLQNHDLSMDKIAKSEMMFGYFMIFEKKNGTCGICSGKKKENVSRGKTVERPSNAVERPKKAWKGLNKAWKGFPNKNDMFLVVLDMGSRNKTTWFRFAIFLFMIDSAQDPVSWKYWLIIANRVIVASYWNLLKQSLRVDLIGMRSFGALYTVYIYIYYIKYKII